jgi:hypothetical protein
MSPTGPPFTGDLILRQNADYGITVVDAPPLARMVLELLRSSHPGVIVEGDHVSLVGQVVYRIIAWDSTHAALIMELIEDHRPKAAGS